MGLSHHLWSCLGESDSRRVTDIRKRVPWWGICLACMKLWIQIPVQHRTNPKVQQNSHWHEWSRSSVWRYFVSRMHVFASSVTSSLSVFLSICKKMVWPVRFGEDYRRGRLSLWSCVWCTANLATMGGQLTGAEWPLLMFPGCPILSYPYSALKTISQ